MPQSISKPLSSFQTRRFIGNTTMDPQLSLLMSNLALVRNGGLVLDPFVGTGSLLVAAAQFGGYVMGGDIGKAFAKSKMVIGSTLKII